MSTSESRILSILRPGDMLRFVYCPNSNKRTSFHVEGAAATVEGDTLLSERLALVLAELRSEGYQFNDAGIVGETDGSFSHRGDALWVEINPQVLSSPCVGFGRFGVGFDDASNASVGSVILPDFPAMPEEPLLDSPSILIGEVPGLFCFEVEFIRKDLPADITKPLAKTLRLQMAAQRPEVPSYETTLGEAFLTSWIWHRSGWRVTARACLRKRKKLPIAALEMIGRDLFHCECEVKECGLNVDSGNILDFGRLFPRGWPLPKLLPAVSDVESLTASRLHNANLPKLPAKGLRIGTVEKRGVRLPYETRDRHTYIVGGTGTGKTTLLGKMIREDMRRGEGVILLDPHGDLYHEVLESVPLSRRDQVFFLDPASDEKLPGLNILDIPESRLRNRQANFIVGELLRLFEEVWDMRQAGGPTFELYFRNTLLLMCMQDGKDYAENPEVEEAMREVQKILGKESETKAKAPEIELPLSLRDFTRVMVDNDFREELLKHCTDPSVVEFWKEVALKTSGDYRLSNFVPYITSKVNTLSQSGFLADLLCARRNDLRIRERMNRGDIILVNLNKGLLGAHESRLLGTVLMMEIFAAGLHRSVLKESDRRPVNVYVDEFQNFVSDNVALMLSEARKFGLRLTLANQTLAQLRTNPGRQDLLETVLGNVGNVVLFRLGVPDADRLQLFTEPYTRQEMQELPNFHAMVRLMTPQGPVRPFIMKTMKP